MPGLPLPRARVPMLERGRGVPAGRRQKNRTSAYARTAGEGQEIERIPIYELAVIDKFFHKIRPTIWAFCTQPVRWNCASGNRNTCGWSQSGCTRREPGDIRQIGKQWSGTSEPQAAWRGRETTRCWRSWLAGPCCKGAMPRSYWPSWKTVCVRTVQRQKRSPRSIARPENRIKPVQEQSEQQTC